MGVLPALEVWVGGDWTAQVSHDVVAGLTNKMRYFGASVG